MSFDPGSTRGIHASEKRRRHVADYFIVLAWNQLAKPATVTFISHKQLEYIAAPAHPQYNPITGNMNSWRNKEDLLWQ